MPARAANRDLADSDAAADVAPQAQATDATSFTTEGEVPAVADEVPDTAQTTASELAYDQSNLSVLDQGMHEAEEYKAACEAAGKPDRWDPKYAVGHSAASQFQQPYEGYEALQWSLKKGHSASEAVRDFVKGPTIADYRVIAVAQDLDELRDDLGEQKFDALFGSKNGEQDAQIPHDQRLMITADMYTTPFVDQMKAIAAKSDEQPELEAEEPVLPPPVEEQQADKPKQPALEDETPIVVAEDMGKHEREIE